MDYIIFLITIQIPFLYLIWKIADGQSRRIARNLQALKKQNEHIAGFMDTLRMSVEKISEDVYGNGKVNARMFEIEKKIEALEKRFQQMELYTGLNTNHSAIEELAGGASLKEKSFR